MAEWYFSQTYKGNGRPPGRGTTAIDFKDPDCTAPMVSRRLALRRGTRHYRRDLAEDRADTGGDARHDRTGGNRDETGHQSIFN